MIDFLFGYGIKHWDKLMTAAVSHLRLVAMAVALSFAASIPLYLIGRKWPKAGKVIMTLANIVYTIPSMAMFALLVPFLGLGVAPALVGLTLYNLFVILKNTNVGFESIPPLVIESGRGMGYDPMQLFLKIELPLAMPSIWAGLKLSSTMTVGLASIASIVNGGGMGKLLFEGMNRRYISEIICASLICAAMSVLFNFVFQQLENHALDKAQGNINNKVKTGGKA